MHCEGDLGHMKPQNMMLFCSTIWIEFLKEKNENKFLN